MFLQTEGGLLITAVNIEHICECGQDEADIVLGPGPEQVHLTVVEVALFLVVEQVVGDEGG